MPMFNSNRKLWTAFAALILSAFANTSFAQTGPGEEAKAPAKEGAVTVKGESKQTVIQRGAPSEALKAAADLRTRAGMAPPPEVRDIRLPGLKPDDPQFKPFVLHTRVGVNEMVTLSSDFLNRISTPFEDPIVVDITDPKSEKHKITGSEVYYLPSGVDPIGIYIFDKGNPTQTISLTIVPRAGIPGQNLLVKLENFRSVRQLSLVPDVGPMVKPASNDFEAMLASLVVGAIRGNVPGFSPVPLEVGEARIDDVRIVPNFVMQGSYLDIYRYKLTNEGTAPIDMNEGAFYREGIKAITFFPHVSLQPGEFTYAFLISEKATDFSKDFASEERPAGRRTSK